MPISCYLFMYSIARVSWIVIQIWSAHRHNENVFLRVGGRTWKKIVMDCLCFMVKCFPGFFFFRFLEVALVWRSHFGVTEMRCKRWHRRTVRDDLSTNRIWMWYRNSYFEAYRRILHDSIDVHSLFNILVSK